MREYTVVEYDAEDYDKLRDNMTVEEAIEELENIQKGWFPYDFDGSERDYSNYKKNVAIDKAISAMKGE